MMIVVTTIAIALNQKSQLVQLMDQILHPWN
jgi:hypothetical protein